MLDALPTSRRDLIADRLAAGRQVVATTLAEEFRVSEDAIRRDLRALAAQGLCKRVYGGALPISPASASLATRIGQHADRKSALACAALQALRPGQMIFLDSGSTNLALAAELPADRNLTVVTNAIPIATTLLPRVGIHLIVIGGAVDPEVGGCIGADAVLELQRLSIDLCFLGACAVSIDEGLACFDRGDAVFKRTLLSVSQEVAALVTGEKLETRAQHRVAPLDRINHLIVEHDTPEALQAALAQVGPRVAVAKPPL